MTKIPTATGRANLSQFVEEARSTQERVQITKNGKRAGVVLGAEGHGSLLETFASLTRLLRGLEKSEAGEVVDAEAESLFLGAIGTDCGSD